MLAPHRGRAAPHRRRGPAHVGPCATRGRQIAEPRGTLLVTEKCRGMEADVGCRLNPVAREIWLYADGRHSIEEIADRVSRRFAVPYAVALEDSFARVHSGDDGTSVLVDSIMS